MNVGSNRLAAQQWQQQLQAQQAERQNRILQLQLQREQDAQAQQDFKNSLDVAQYTRQSDRDRALGQYQQGSLDQRQMYQGGDLEMRRLNRQQRENQFQQKQAQGILTREDIQNHQFDVLDAQHDNAMDLEGYRGRNAQDLEGLRQQGRHDIISQRIAAKLGAPARSDVGPINSQLSRLRSHLGVLVSQEHAIDAQVPMAFTSQQKTGLQAQRDEIKRQQQIVLDEMDRIEISNPQGQGMAPSQLGTGEGDYHGPETQGMPQGVPSTDSGYYLGQIIDTPRGKVRVTKVDDPSDPVVEPI